MGRVFKRRRQDAFTPLQMLQSLSDLQLVAVLQGNSTWLAVDPGTAKLLDHCCTGQQDGGPITALETFHIIEHWRDTVAQALAQGREGATASAAGEGEQGQHPAGPLQQPEYPEQRQQHAHGQQQGTEPLPSSSTLASAADPVQPVAIRLSLEETFFLKFTLGCLTVIKAPAAAPATPAPEPEPEAAAPAPAAAPEPAAAPASPARMEELSEQGLWDACRAIRPNFPISYAGYHHLKCKGWLPRSGLLYGVDYVLYQMHPTAVHSEFGVMLVPSSGPYRPELRWLDVQITNRLINQVSKRLLLLYLHEAEGSPGPGSPACLEYFQAEERLLKRWVPSSTRDEKA